MIDGALNLARTAIIGIAMLAVAGLVLASVSITHAQSESIPSWIKVVAGAWADDTISDAEFIEAMQTLIDSNIIQIDDPIENDYDVIEYEFDMIERGGHVLLDGYGEYLSAPDNKDECYDIDGDTKTPTINIKFTLESWGSGFIDVIGSGIIVDSEQKVRPIFVQLFNSTHPVSYIHDLDVNKSGIQVDDIIFGDTTAGNTYELRSIYNDQCGRTEMTLGY